MVFDIGSYQARLFGAQAQGSYSQRHKVGLRKMLLPHNLERKIREKERKIEKKVNKNMDVDKRLSRYIHELEAGRIPNRTGWKLLEYATPRLLALTAALTITLIVINCLPSDNPRCIERLVAGVIYENFENIGRVPESLESYAHSVKILAAPSSPCIPLPVLKSFGKRTVLDHADIPEKVRIAALACEDHHLFPWTPGQCTVLSKQWWLNTFTTHEGVSLPHLFAGIYETCFKNNKRGGSTIVMQNVKNLQNNIERTASNKFKEIVLAYQMVEKHGKEKNLDFYINTVDFGNGFYGFSAAAEGYFGKNLKELNMQQLLALGSFIPNHNRQIALYKIVNGKSFNELNANMQRHAREAAGEINSRLRFLRDLAMISPTQYDEGLIRYNASNKAVSERSIDERSIRKIGFQELRLPPYGKEEWITRNVIKEVCSNTYVINGIEIPGKSILIDQKIKGDFRIETSLDIQLTEEIKEIISEFLKSKPYRNILRARNRKTWQEDYDYYLKGGKAPPYEKDFESFLNYLEKHINAGAILLRGNKVIAYVGGKEFLRGSGISSLRNHEQLYRNNNQRHIIIDLMKKGAEVEPGSTMKPFVYYYILAKGRATPESLFKDAYIVCTKDGCGPNNWNGRPTGKYFSLSNALVKSKNTIIPGIYHRDRIVKDALTNGFDKAGLKYNRSDAQYYPFAMGATGIPTWQLLGMYRAFTDGYYFEPSFVEKIWHNGTIVYDRETGCKQKAVLFLDNEEARLTVVQGLYDVCNHGCGKSIESEFKQFTDLIAGKTGTSDKQRATIFISSFNPCRNRTAYADKTYTLIVVVGTNTGGFKRVGYSTEGPVKIGAKIYNSLFKKELASMIERVIEAERQGNAIFRKRFDSNDIYKANIDRYLKTALTGVYKNDPICKSIIGVDGFQRLLEQIISPENEIYTGKDELFNRLIAYYCDKSKLVKGDRERPAK